MTGRSYITWPATAKPSARRDTVNQTCKQTWNAAISVGPNLAANDAANVTQNVTAMTLINNRNPDIRGEKENEKKRRQQLMNQFHLILGTLETFLSLT